MDKEKKEMSSFSLALLLVPYFPIYSIFHTNTGRERVGGAQHVRVCKQFNKMSYRGGVFEFLRS